MNAPRQFGLLFPLCIACGSVLAVSAAAPDERDRRVLETLLLHLLSDSEFDMTRVSIDKAMILLHERTPGKTGLLHASPNSRRNWHPQNTERRGARYAATKHASRCQARLV